MICRLVFSESGLTPCGTIMLRWWDSLFESLDFLGVVGVALTSVQNMSERRIVVKYVSSGYKMQILRSVFLCRGDTRT